MMRSGGKLVSIKTAFASKFGSQPALIARAPGRVNLLGEHVDYNDGPVLPAALDMAVSLAFAPNPNGVISLHALDLDKRVAFTLESITEKKDRAGNRLPNWALYPAGVAWALEGAGFAVPGMQGVYTSDIPIGSGLSSSAAVEVAFAVAWQELGGWQASRMLIAQLCQRAENAYVGVASGLMDQFASAHGVAGKALYFDTRSLEWEPVPLPSGTSLVIADSRVPRSLTGSAYNQRRASCEQAVEILRQYKSDLRSLRDISPVEFAAYKDFLPEEAGKRAEHVIKEIARVQSAVRALELGETRSFGALMFAGHASLRDLYQVSTPELDILVETARGLNGCIGARLTGAGFGGCTVNLVEDGFVEQFVEELKRGYQIKTGHQSLVYKCQASAGAAVLKVDGGLIPN
jgi:galactokinase